MKGNYIQELNRFYNSKYEKHGNSVESLGCSEEGQIERFKIFSQLERLDGMHVLDVGSGLGHFATYIQTWYPSVQYTGYEINPNFIKQTVNRPSVSFEMRNILDEPPSRKFDVVYSIGALNTRFEGNEKVMQSFIEALFDCCTHMTAISMTSVYVDEEYRDENTMYYYDPCKIFTHAKSLTKRVKLLHDYLPHDFTVVLYKG